MAASKVTPEAINHMILHGRGLICVPLLPNQLGRLGISSMVPHNREAQKKLILPFPWMLPTELPQELVHLIGRVRLRFSISFGLS